MKKNFITQVLLLCALLLQFVFFTDEVKSEECLSYKPAKVRLTGTLVERTFPGPPEFESIEKGDEPEARWILKLTKPVCVNANEEYDIDFVSETDITAVQLALLREYARYKHLVNKKVIAEGTLFHRTTGYDFTTVLMWVTDMKLAE